MRIGAMDRLMAVYKYVEPAGAGLNPTFRFQSEEWMARKSLRADERYSSDAKQRYADVAERFTSWPIEGLEITDLLKDERGQWWDIRAIVEVGYNEAFEIDATLRLTPPEIAPPLLPDPPSGYPWKHGDAGLVNHPPIPKWHANRTPIEIEEKVLHLRSKYHLVFPPKKKVMLDLLRSSVFVLLCPKQ